MQNLRYEEPVVLNTAYELASEGNGVNEELYEEPIENALYDLAYENPNGTGTGVDENNYDLAD